MGSENLHEPRETLSDKTIDMHRAITSLMEEMEAVDWYQQRVDATDDEELRAILAHNRDEEAEHAVMVIEWLRRNYPRFAEELAERLGRPGPIVAADHGHGEGHDHEPEPPDPSLGIGSLKHTGENA